jgi:hypothetical protein
MGKMGAESLLKRINHPKAPYRQQVIVQPELVIRESTAKASSRSKAPAQKRGKPGSRSRVELAV